jgi:acyl dehydratase
MQRATPETPVGFELDGVKKVAVIQIMGSRHWGRVNPIHFDPVTAAQHGFKAPIQTGMMSAAYLAETCVNFLGASLFENATMEGKFVRPIYAGEVITTHGVVKAREPEGDGVRLTIDLWADNEEGEVKTVATVTALVKPTGT